MSLSHANLYVEQRNDPALPVDETQSLEMLLESCSRSSAVLAILGGAPPIR